MLRRVIDHALGIVRSHDGPRTVFIVLAALGGLFFMIVSPPLWGADEGAHMARAYQLSQGHLLPATLGTTPQSGGLGGNVPRGLSDLMQYRNYDLGVHMRLSPYGTGLVDSGNKYREINGRSVNNGVKSEAFANTAIYSPVGYLPYLPAVWLSQLFGAGAGVMVLMARLIGLVVSIALGVWALRILRGYRIAWLVATLGLLTTTVYQSSIVSVDMLVNGTALLFGALIIKGILARRYTRPELITLVSLAIVIPLLKPNYVLLLPLILLVPAAAFGLWQRYRPRAALLGLGVLCVLSWLVITHGMTDAIKFVRPDLFSAIDPSRQLVFILTHPIAYALTIIRTLLADDGTLLNGLFGIMGGTDIAAPGIAILLGIAAVGVALWQSEPLVVSRRARWLLGGVIGLSIVGIVTSLYLTYNAVGAGLVGGVQFRYFIPLMLPALMLCLTLRKPELKLKRLTAGPQAGVLLSSLLATGLFISCVTFYYMLWQR